MWFRSRHQLGLTVDAWGPGLLLLAEAPNERAPQRASATLTMYDDDRPRTRRWREAWAAARTASAQPAQGGDDDGVVGGLDGTQVEHRHALAGPGDDRRVVGAQRGEVVAGDGARRTTGSSPRAPTRRRGGRRSPTASAPVAGGDRRCPGGQLVHRRRGHPPERDRRHDVAAEVGERDVLQGGEDEPARAQGAGERVPAAALDEVARARR